MDARTDADQLAIVRRGIDAFVASDPPDVETLREVLDPDCVITTG